MTVLTDTPATAVYRSTRNPRHARPLQLHRARTSRRQRLDERCVQFDAMPKLNRPGRC